tara:strand:+ start:993 stop:1319 length:327 start_codon:yes stop_codon:yes gene_type:complete
MKDHQRIESFDNLSKASISANLSKPFAFGCLDFPFWRTSCFREKNFRRHSETGSNGVLDAPGHATPLGDHRYGRTRHPQLPGDVGKRAALQLQFRLDVVVSLISVSGH